MKLPENYQAVMPYLILENADEFITFTQSVFDAQLTKKSFTNDGKTIAHAEVLIGGCTIMFSNVSGQWKIAPANMFVYVLNVDETLTKRLQKRWKPKSA